MTALLSVGQTLPPRLLMYDDVEASGKPVYGVNNGTPINVNRWTGKSGSNTYGSVARSNEVPARKGSFSYKFVLNNAPVDGWENVKSELHWNFLPAGSPLGTVGNNEAFYRNALGLRWMSISTYLPSGIVDFNTPTSIGFNTKSVEDDYGTPNYLYTYQGKYWFMINELNTNGSVSRTFARDCGPVVKNQWEDWILHRNFVQDNTGFVRFYRVEGGVPVLKAEYLGPNWRIANHSKEPYVQHGLYKWAFQNSWSPTPDVNQVVMYIDEIRFGDSTATITDMLVDPVPGNVAPSANAGADANITLPTNTVNLSGGGADSDGTIAGYLWTQVSGPNTATLSGASSANATASNLVAGTYVFRLRVTDDDGAIATDDKQVTVNPPPTNVGPTITTEVLVKVLEPAPVVSLIANVLDSDGSVVSVNWQKKDNNPGTINNPNSTIPTVTGLLPGTKNVFEVTAVDDDGAVTKATVYVEVVRTRLPSKRPGIVN